LVSSGGKLDALQLRVLESLAGVEPRFVLSGGAALAGVHLGHRTTRDLDLFWRLREELGDLPGVVEQRLTKSGLSVAALQTTPSFVRLRIGDGLGIVLLGLISEPMDAVDAAEPHHLAGKEILVDSPRSILAEKLCALLERSELRDLVDIEALVRSGQNLETAIADAPKRDQGFSPLTLAWVLRDFDVAAMARTSGRTADAARLESFREELIETLVDPKR
jgi:hypothetical protein